MTKMYHYPLQLTRTQTLLIAFVLFICLLGAFFSGFFIGEKYTIRRKSDLRSPSDSASVKTSPKPPITSKTLSTPDESYPNEFTFYDALVKNAEPITKIQETMQTPTALKSSKKTQESNEQIPFNGPGKKYTIQLGSFRQSEMAYALMNQLKKRGFIPYLTREEIPQKGTWYRVRMGKFDSLEEAQEWISQLGNISPPPFITTATD